MRRQTLALLAGATLLITGASTGTALAQDTDPPETGPGTQACTDARGALGEALVAVDATVGIGGNGDLDAISDRLGELAADAEVSAALALVGEARTACTPPAQDGDDAGQDDGGDVTPAPTPEPGSGDDSAQDGTDDAPQPGDPCTTDEIASGILGGNGECIGSTGGPTTTPAPVGSGSDGGTSTGGQVTTVPRGWADTGAL